MGKPHYHNKWHRKYKQNPRKRETQKTSVSLQSNQKKWSLIEFFLGGLKLIPKTINYTLMLFFKPLQNIPDIFHFQPMSRVRSCPLETRVHHLEILLQEYSSKIELLQSKIDQASGNREITHLSPSVVPPPMCLPNVPPPPPPLPSCLLPPPAPPLPPPPPPVGLFSIQQPALKKPIQKTEKKSVATPVASRLSISVDDLLSVRLKKTPAVQKTDKALVLTPANELLPRISLEALRSVKLKRTPLVTKETGHEKTKSPKGKLTYRQVLRRTPTGFKSPGGTPKTRLVNSPDEMTPALTRALQNRFRAFHMSPEDDKENDMQFA